MSLRLRAPAKLTRSLRVGGVRPDGYHDVTIEAVHLSLADDLVLDRADTPSVTVTTDVDWIDARAVPIGADNLALRATLLTGTPTSIHLTKRIPLSGGLGGGSADAAAVLRALGAPPQRAVELGSDVPLCLALGHVRATGRGEAVTLLADLAATVTLIVPTFGISTVDVYRTWDALGGPHDDREDPNDLEPAAFTVEPRLAELAAAASRRVGERPRLAGAGSTLVWWASFDELGFVAQLERAGVRARAERFDGLPVWLIEATSLPRQDPIFDTSTRSPVTQTRHGGTRAV